MGRSIYNRLQDPLVGSVVQQRYHVVRAIGSGSVADVYLARQSNLGGRRVALRVLRPALAEADHGLQGIHRRRFLHEVQLASLFKGPAFARVIDGGMMGDPKRPYVVQELLEGPLLSELLQPGPLSWREAGALLLQLCTAAEEMHAYGVLYRDFSPSNVIVEEQRGVGRVARLFDFSHATLEGVSLLESEGAAEDLAGSPIYSAPELGSLGEVPDRSADTFSLGALLYLACSGQPPVRSQLVSGWSDWVSWAREGRPVPEAPLRSLATRVPAALERLTGRALSIRPSDRFPDAGALGRELRAILGLRCEQEEDAGGFSLGTLLGRLRK